MRGQMLSKNSNRATHLMIKSGMQAVSVLHDLKLLKLIFIRFLLFKRRLGVPILWLWLTSEIVYLILCVSSPLFLLQVPKIDG